MEKARPEVTDRKEAEYYFPFRLAQNSKALQGPLASRLKYFCDVRDELIHVGGSQETVSDVFERASDYKIPLIEYLDASPKQIHEVFHLYNRQGKHLNAEEIRNALFHDVDLVRLVLVASGDNPAAATLRAILPHKRSYQLLKNISKGLDDYRFGTGSIQANKDAELALFVDVQPSVSNKTLLSFVRLYRAVQLYHRIFKIFFNSVTLSMAQVYQVYALCTPFGTNKVDVMKENVQISSAFHACLTQFIEVEDLVESRRLASIR